jgi:hypothetical protein
LTSNGESSTVTLEASDTFVVPIEDGNEEGVDFYRMCCERPPFTLDVGVEPYLWDATYFAWEVVVLGKYHKSWGKKGLSYVMLNDNPMGYAYLHLVCYVNFQCH